MTQILTDNEIPTVFFNCPAEIKEIKESAFGTDNYVTQKFTEITEIYRFASVRSLVPKALSVISVNFCVTIKFLLFPLFLRDFKFVKLV